MTASSAFVRLLAILPLALILSGCFLPNEGPVDEEKDPHFLAGKNHATSLDYDGAIVAFENALISNPKNAAAHFELGLLCEEHKADFAAAIYHYEKHLELRPQSRLADTIRQRIMNCRVEIGKTVSFYLVNQKVQAELRRLSTTNSWLLEQNEQLRNQLAQQATFYSNRLAQVTQAAAEGRVAAQNRVQAQVQSLARNSSYPGASYTEPDARPTYYSDHSTPPVASPRNTSTPTASRTTVRSPSLLPEAHVVKAGETMATVAKKYNIKLSALHLANPGVGDRPLRAGQILNLPSGRN